MFQLWEEIWTSKYMKLIGSIQIQPEENFRKTHDNSSVKNKKDQKDESRKKTNKNKGDP